MDNKPTINPITNKPIPIGTTLGSPLKAPAQKKAPAPKSKPKSPRYPTPKANTSAAPAYKYPNA